LLRGIRALLYVDGMTIKGVQKVLRDKGLRYVSEIGRGEASLHGKPNRPPREKFHRQLRTVDFSEEALPAKIPETQKKLHVVSEPVQASSEEASEETPHRQTLSAEVRARLETLLVELLQLKTRLAA
jgi:hypothetical protein